jgi:hypothetical protein
MRSSSGHVHTYQRFAPRPRAHDLARDRRRRPGLTRCAGSRSTTCPRPTRSTRASTSSRSSIRTSAIRTSRPLLTVWPSRTVRPLATRRSTVSPSPWEMTEPPHPVSARGRRSPIHGRRPSRITVRPRVGAEIAVRFGSASRPRPYDRHGDALAMPARPFSGTAVPPARRRAMTGRRRPDRGEHVAPQSTRARVRSRRSPEACRRDRTTRSGV